MRFQDYYATALRQGWFDPCFYFDVLQSGGISMQGSKLSLFEHYATIGWRHGLSPSEHFSVEGYLERYKDVADRQVDHGAGARTSTAGTNKVSPITEMAPRSGWR